MTTASTISVSATAGVLTEKARISSIDVVRGVVMVIMALDHARDFFHKGGLFNNPADLATTTPALFFTRWVTHFCAPAFVFLAGTSIYISAKRKSTNELSMFLLTRGIWLMVIEFVVIRFSFFFNFYYDIIIMQVIWAIGACMVCMALLIRLPYYVVLSLGAAITLFRNVFDSGASLGPSDAVAAGGGGGAWKAVFFQGGFFNLDQSHSVFVIYPLVPWLGILMLGYCLGKLYTGVDSERRRKLLMMIGLSAVGLFIALRLINVYGDPAPWSVQKNGLFTFMSFINTTKYPISLLYALMTLGPALIALSLLEGVKSNAIMKPFQVIGRVPLFYYILHFYLIHLIALLLFMNKTGKSLSEIDFHINAGFGGLTAENGYSLGWVYVGWITVVLFLYPLCYWYNRYKSTHKDWWLSYL